MASSIAVVQYMPGPVPNDPKDLQRYLTEEFGKIAAAIDRMRDGHMDVVYAPPAKPRDGDWRHADGTDWNPGSGKGFYRFNGSTWVFLG